MTVSTMTIDLENGDVDMTELLEWIWANNKRYHLEPIFHQGSKPANLGGISGYTLYFEDTDKSAILTKLYGSDK